MGQDSLIFKQEFDLSHLPLEQKFEAWADSMSGYGEHKALENTLKASNWNNTAWVVDNLIVTENNIGPFTAIRGPKIIRQAYFEHVLVRLVLQGSQDAIFDEKPAQMRAGDIHIFDLNANYHATTNDMLASLVVIVPYSVIGYDPKKHPPHILLPPNDPANRMLRNTMFSLRSQMSSLLQSEAPKVARGFAGLLRGLLMPESDDEQARRQVELAKLNMIKQYIEDNIRNPQLDINLLCKKFAMSRATIYRMFAADEGVASYINERRLIHAFRQLGSVEGERGRVQSIASEFGFDDQGHFSRLFRNRFMITPSEAMGIWHEDPMQNTELNNNQHIPDQLVLRARIET